MKINNTSLNCGSLSNLKSIFLIVGSIFIGQNTVLSQKGPGGVGTTDGTSNLSLWLDAGTITGIANNANMTGTWEDLSGTVKKTVIYGPKTAATFVSLVFNRNCLSTSAVVAKKKILQKLKKNIHTLLTG